MNESIYKERNDILKLLNDRRIKKKFDILNDSKLKYKPIFNDNSNIVHIPFNTSINNNTKTMLNKKYPKNCFVYKMNDSVQKIVRKKEVINK